jgi:hypothetical protein
MHTSYATAIPALREGQLSELGYKAESYVAEGAVRAGLLIVRGSSRKQAQHPAAIPAADTNSLKLSFNSSTAVQSFDTIAEFDGATGMGRISPAVPVTMTFDAGNVADWNNPSGSLIIEVYGIDASGNKIKDSMIHVNGAGAETISTELCFAAVHQIDFPNCNGNTGTGEIGTSAAKAEYGKLDVLGIAIYDRATEPAATTGYDFDDTEAFSVLKNGKIGVTVEDAVALDDPVYVRVVAAGADLRGQFTGDLQADDANFALLLGARYTRAAAGDGIAELELRY